MSKSTWLSLGSFTIALLSLVSATPAENTKLVFIRALAREGRRVYVTTETVDLHTIRRFEVTSSARIRLQFPRPPYGNLEFRTVTLNRFIALYGGKDKKKPQPTTLKSPFSITLRGQKITAIQQQPQ